MKIRFWGVRGSLPAPLTPGQIKSKIASIVERIRPQDLESPLAKERFLAELPPWLFGTAGSNTPCLEVRSDKEDVIIFDAGSGIRELGLSVQKEREKQSTFHVFFSHFHWDHVHGLPFFGPAYDPSVKIHFYSPWDDLESILRNQMLPPYFPVTMDAMGAQKTFHKMDDTVALKTLTVSCKKMNHPGSSFSYVVTDGVKRMIYATDTELSTKDFLRTAENTAFFDQADLLVIDSQYTLGEAIEKYNWGHNAFSLAVDFASNWRIRHLVLFHHDPTYDDKKLFGILQSARWYTEHMAIKDITVSLAIEGVEITL
jgi:phosphoribosyl 1,2-cyclic phosphodiesterase